MDTPASSIGIPNGSIFTRTILASSRASDSPGGLRGGSVRSKRHQELSDPRPWFRIRLSDPHHQRTGEAADDRG